MNLDKLKQLLVKHEGNVLKMYKCSAGKNTIGVGHNLDANPISHRASMVILEDDIEEIVNKPLNTYAPWWTSLDEVRQLALADLCFNMGWGTLSQFKNTLKALQEGRYEDAAKGLESSLWYTQVGSRAKTVVNMVRTGAM